MRAIIVYVSDRDKGKIRKAEINLGEMSFREFFNENKNFRKLFGNRLGIIPDQVRRITIDLK